MRFDGLYIIPQFRTTNPNIYSEMIHCSIYISATRIQPSLLQKQKCIYLPKQGHFTSKGLISLYPELLPITRFTLRPAFTWYKYVSGVFYIVNVNGEYCILG